MPAAQQVFDIAELLEIIICQVDAHQRNILSEYYNEPTALHAEDALASCQIRELKLVNRSWRDAISTSWAIRRARVVEGGSNLSLEITEDEDIAEMVRKALCNSRFTNAIYDAEDWIRVNPSLKKVHTVKVTETTGHYADENDDYFELTLRLPSLVEVGSLSLDEFVTDPPCQEITMSRMYWDQTEDWWLMPFDRVVYSVSQVAGVKIRDILTVRDQLDGQEMDDVLEGEEIVASLLIDTKHPRPQSVEDMRVCISYSDGPLPRYRKASHRLGSGGVKAYLQDQALEWHPNMDVKPSEDV